ncbi:hypothetical protein DVR12_13815 [Chitinophaga silvatica]|uniref:Uncharacterized protein n=1 Tax=Chitinophaga silvatica TaxID=2282649 RepID=A0A3E1Y8K3_9BACT|nr:hypothetical protein [Chitinophaga silvatica]RFS21733.1 hypothetical protein DVR12_13815 [Chitinophaga silvatica]
MAPDYHTIRGFKGLWARVSIPLSQQHEKYATKAEEVFEEFLQNIPCSKKTLLGFTIYIEPDIDYSRQSDTAMELGWDLQCHIDNKIFNKAKVQEKLSLVLTACQLLLDYKANQPGYRKRRIDYAGLARKLQLFLKKKKLYYKDSSFFIKPDANTQFRIISITGPYADKKLLKFDLHKLEPYINDKLAQQKYGGELRLIYFNFGIYKFDGVATSFFENKEKLTYSSIAKSIFITRSIDYNIIIKLNKDKLLNYYIELFKENLNLIDDSKKIPKKFNYISLKESLIQNLDIYKP